MYLVFIYVNKGYYCIYADFVVKSRMSNPYKNHVAQAPFFISTEGESIASAHLHAALSLPRDFDFGLKVVDPDEIPEGKILWGLDPQTNMLLLPNFLYNTDPTGQPQESEANPDHNPDFAIVNIAYAVAGGVIVKNYNQWLLFETWLEKSIGRRISIDIFAFSLIRNTLNYPISPNDYVANICPRQDSLYNHSLEIQYRTQLLGNLQTMLNNNSTEPMSNRKFH